MSAPKKVFACSSVPEVTFHFDKSCGYLPAFLPYVMPTPRGCASFPAIREGFVATPLCLPSLLSAAFPFVLSILSQLSKSHLLGMLALLPSVSVGPTFCVPFCFEWSSWSYSAALLQLFFFFLKKGGKREILTAINVVCYSKVVLVSLSIPAYQKTSRTFQILSFNK